MKKAFFWTLALSMFLVLRGEAQQKPVTERSDPSARGAQGAAPESPTANGLPSTGEQAIVPRLVKFSGVLNGLTRNPLSGPMEVTFALHKDDVGGEPLWTETQTVEVDKDGRYTVLLGATQVEGLPVELFSTGEAHWLGVEIQGQPQQPRTLLVSVAYALKAAEAEKLAGKSASDFVLSESLGEQVRQVIQAQGQIALQSAQTGTGAPPQKQTVTSNATTANASPSSAGPMFPPSSFSGTNSTQIVSVQQNGSGNGLYGFTGGPNAFGVFGVGPNGTGVVGATNSPSGNGVYGQTNNGQRSGFGVLGNATATTGNTVGVGGLAASPNGSGVAGYANATSGSNSGVFGQSASPNGSGVFGTSGQWVGVGGQATATSGGPAFGVWGDSLSTGGTGVAGFADATSGYTNGVMGTSDSPNGNGVFGVNNAATGGNGVVGVSNATSGGISGVLGVIHSTVGAGTSGVASATTGFNNGVYGANFSDEGVGVSGNAYSTSGSPVGVSGSSAGANGGIGVWGIFQATSGGGVGVRGDLESPTATGAAGLFLTLSPTSVAGQFANFSRQGLILQGLSGPFDATQTEVFRVDSSGNLHITGNLTVDGTKSSTAKLQDGREVALYAVESPENWFEDFGSTELINGVAWVPLDASFAQTVSAGVGYHVFLTPNGDSNGLYVARKTAAGFEIKEHSGGTSNVAVDYRIVARRRGYETIRLLQAPERKTPGSFSQHVELATARPKVEAVRIPPSTLAPMIHPVPPSRPNVPQVPKLNAPQPH